MKQLMVMREAYADSNLSIVAGYPVIDLLTYEVKIMSADQINELRELDYKNKCRLYFYDSYSNEVSPAHLSYISDDDYFNYYDLLYADCYKARTVDTPSNVHDTVFGSISDDPMFRAEDIALMKISGAVKISSEYNMYIKRSIPVLEVPYGIGEVIIHNNIRIGKLIVPDTVKMIRGVNKGTEYSIGTLVYKRPLGANACLDAYKHIENMEVDLSVLHEASIAMVYGNINNIEIMELPQLTTLSNGNEPYNTTIYNNTIKKLIIGKVLTYIGNSALRSYTKLEVLEIHSRAFCVSKHSFSLFGYSLKRIVVPKRIHEATLDDLEKAIRFSGKNIKIEFKDF